MKLRGIKLWQWVLAGLAMGLALSWLHAGSQQFGDGAWRPGIDQAQFESLLRMTKLPHPPPVFRDLTIYPTIDNKTYVCGDFLINLSDPTRYRKFEYFATNPLDVRSFLSSKYPGVSYTYAWWKDVRIQRAFWLAFPLCIIAAVCPMLVRAFGTKHEPVAVGATADQPAPAPVSVALPEPDPAEETAEAPQQPTAPAVAALSSEPLEAMPASVEEEKDYKGEYYPVARHATPKT